MKKYIKYIILFFVAYVAINVGMKFYTAGTWKENPVAIEKLIKHCTTHTKTQFETLDLSIEKEAKEFIFTGKNFSDPNKPEKEFYKRCISNAIYYYSPSEYFNETKVNK